MSPADPGSPLPTWPAPRYAVATSPRAAASMLGAALGDRAIGVWLIRTHERGSTRRQLAPVRGIAIARERERVGDEPSAVVIPDEYLHAEDLRNLVDTVDAPYVVAHDAQDLLHWLTARGVSPRRLGSTAVAAVLLSEGTARGTPDLRACVERVLEHGLPGDDLPRPMGLEPEPAESATRADAVLATMERITPMLRKRELSTVYDLECRLLPAVVDMERAGVALDAPAFQAIADDWVRERETATDPARISRLDKLISTYGHWAREFVDDDGRVRCSLHPLAADSGRFSCSDPNLQQVPSNRTAPGLRATFVPAPGHRFIIADYAQIELRVAAHLAPDDRLRQVFRDAGDPHRTTAARIVNKPESEISPHERKLAKAVNFGFLFGMGAARFQSYAADGYGVELTDAEARRAREAFFETFPGIKAWHDRVGQLGRHDGAVVVKTALGRRRRFDPGKFSFNAALNIPVQGTAAEGFKLAMIELRERLATIGGRGVLCVHDEYIAEVPEARADEGRRIVERTMIEGMARVVPSVPIVVEARVSTSWS